jgi:hypothetical protein
MKMMRTGRYATVIVLACCCPSAYSSAAYGTDSSDAWPRSAYALKVVTVQTRAAVGPADDKKVIELLQQLEMMPAWTRLSWGELRTRESILVTMANAATYDPDVVREAVKRLLIPWRQRKPEGFDRAMKVFLLNRYLFELPIRGPESERYSLWPLGADHEGRLQLVGTFQGWGGGVADELEMFDRFRRRYGFRKRTGWIHLK